MKQLLLSVSINSGSAETYAQVHSAPPGERERILSVIRRISRRSSPPLLCASMVLLQPNAREAVSFVKTAITAGVHAINLLGLRCADLFPTLVLDDTEELRAELEAAGALARQAGVGLEFHNLPQTRGHAEAVEPLHWSLGCFIGYQFVRIDVDGNLEGCCSCENHLGCLADASFPEAWHSRAYQEFREHGRRMPETKSPPPGCNCVDCGNVSDNAEVYRALGFRPVRGPRKPRLSQ